MREVNFVRELVVVRHGESTGNAQGLAQGRLDYPLTERGRDDVRAAAARMTENGWTFSHRVTSPVQRCVESAELLVGALGGAAFDVDEAFTEIDCGSATGRRYRDVMKEHPQFFERPANEWLGFAELGGESNAELLARVGAGLDAIGARDPIARVLLVTHGGVFKAVLAHLLALPTNFFLDLQYSSILRLVRKKIGAQEVWAWSHFMPPHNEATDTSF